MRPSAKRLGIHDDVLQFNQSAIISGRLPLSFHRSYQKTYMYTVFIQSTL